MKKSLSLILAVVLVIACAVTAVQADPAPTVSVSNPSAKSGETVEINFTFEGFPDITGYGLFFDEVAEVFTSVSGGNNIGNPTLNDFDPEKVEDGLVCAFDKAIDLNGNVATFTFEVDEDAVSGEYQIEVYYSIEASGYDAKITGTVVSTITVEGKEPEPAEPSVIVEAEDAAAGENVTVTVSFENFEKETALAITYDFDEEAFKVESAEWKLEDAVIEEVSSPAVIAFEEPTDINGLVFVLNLIALDTADGDYTIDFEVIAESDKENKINASAEVEVEGAAPAEVEINVVPFRAYTLGEEGNTLYSDINMNKEIGTLDSDTEYFVSKIFDNGACEVAANDDRENVIGYVSFGTFVHETEQAALEEVVAEDEYTSYIRPNGDVFGSTDPEDVCYVCYKGEEFVQAFYPVSGCYKLGWFANDDLYGQGEESSEESTEESSEEPSEEPSVEPSEEPSNPPTPPQGDAGIIALAVVSVVTLAGVVVVKKSK